MFELDTEAKRTAAQINQLINDVWVATEDDGPRFDDFDLTDQQHAVLAVIMCEPEITPHGLAEQFGISKGAVTQQLDRLEELGYLTRQRSEQDRRVQKLVLEKNGKRYQRRYRKYAQRTLSRYASLSPAETEEVITALEKLKTAIES